MRVSPRPFRVEFPGRWEQKQEPQATSGHLDLVPVDERFMFRNDVYTGRLAFVSMYPACVFCYYKVAHREGEIH